MMRLMFDRTRRAMALLLCAAFALGSVVAQAAAPAPAHEMAAAAMHEGAPCDMPGGCCDEQPSLECLLACAGLAAALPSFDHARLPVTLCARAAEKATDLLVGRQREPDKPPPKFLLA